jgi:hypothetical protein
MTLMESIVHGLRMRGWSRIEAEGEALERIERMRASAIEARRAATEGAVHESAVGEAETPKEHD